MKSFRRKRAVKQQQQTVTSWYEIDWKGSYERVRTIQGQIVRAVEADDWDLVKKLQRKLITMLEARAIAIRRVVTNQGGKTPGVDGIIWNTPESRFKAIEALKAIVNKPNEYKAAPARRVYIPKPGTNEQRPLGIPSVIDRATQAVYLLAVDPVLECKSDNNSYGGRTYRSAQGAVTILRSLLDKPNSPKWVFETDIAKCFDKIDHKFLLENTPICDRNVLKQWLDAGYMYLGEIEDTPEGAPQGGIISPLLCNVALNGLEEHVLKSFPPVADKNGTKPKVHLIRYVDDIVVTGNSKEILEQVRPLIEEFLKVKGLALKEAKTRIVHLSEGFDFLGFNFKRHQLNPSLNKANSKQESTLVITPSKKNIQRFKDNLRRLIQPGKPLEALIRDLNPVLKGWSEYFRISYHSQEVFITLNNYMWELMMNWVSKRHPGVAINDLTKKYLVANQSHRWTWGLNPNELLINLAETTVWVMRPIKFGMNPYVPEQREYLERARQGRVDAKFKAAIFKKYQHTCLVCGESLHNGERIELHHLKSVKEGGKYTWKNIQPLHKVCHQKITYQQIVSSKLR